MTGDSGYKKLDRRTFVGDEADRPEGQAPPAEEHASASDKPTFVQQLEERTHRAEEQLGRYAQSYKEELQAEVTRTQERLGREAARELARLRADLVGELLEVLDNLDRSLAAIPADAEAGIRQGLELVREQFWATLTRQGLEEVPALGEPFDPAVHEAATTAAVTDPAQDRRVLRVLKPGYRLAGTLLRPALVQVGQRS
jgi:molecular chaperone GrpE